MPIPHQLISDAVKGHGPLLHFLKCQNKSEAPNDTDKNSR
jgi:hypothetical protein